MIYWAMIDNMSRRLTGESTQTWRDDHTELAKPPSPRSDALLGPPGHGGVGARPVPATAARAQRHKDQHQALELQGRAILPALQCEAGQDHPQMTRDGLRPLLRLILPVSVGAYRKDGQD